MATLSFVCLVSLVKSLVGLVKSLVGLVKSLVGLVKSLVYVWVTESIAYSHLDAELGSIKLRLADRKYCSRAPHAAVPARFSGRGAGA